MPGVCVVTVSEICDLIYGAEVWGIVQGACDLQSDDAQTFLIIVGKGWHNLHLWRDVLAVSVGSDAPRPRNPRSS